MILDSQKGPPPKPSQKGKKISNYVYNYSDQIGKGNFAQVYKATNTLNSISSLMQTNK
jgi:hypothetical protein